MDEREIIGVIESILFVSGDPVSAKEISRILDLDVRLVRKYIKKMIDSFQLEQRGLQIVMVNDTYQLATKPEYSEYIERYLGQVHKQICLKLVLETLAIIAYQQPVTKADIEAIRGVKCTIS